jgi:hypothetical protein
MAVMVVVPLAMGALAPGAAAKRKIIPTAGRTVVIAPIHGTVRVKVRGARRFQHLRRTRAVRLGARIDASRGEVRLVAANGARNDTGFFSKGAFVVNQTRGKPRTTELQLVGGRPEVCAQGARAASLSPRIIRRLHGRAHGHFRTRGRNSAATVRGTVWDTEDRCDGTVVTSQEGTVDTTTQLGNQDFQLDPGQSLIGYCVDITNPNLTCFVEVSNPTTLTYLFVIATIRPATSYQVCAVSPAGVPDCGTFPLNDDDGDGVRASGVGCVFSGTADGTGTYYAQWTLDGTVFGPLFFTAPLVGPSTTETCIVVNGT